MRSLGFRACTFESPEAFLNSPRLNDTSCVISDVRMPSMTGLELQTRLVAQGRRIPVIFVTAFPDQGVQERARSAGAIAFLTKPFDGGTLVTCIEAALARDSKA